MSKYQILDRSKKEAIGEAVVLGENTMYFLFKDIAFTKTVETEKFMSKFGNRISKIERGK